MVVAVDGEQLKPVIGITVGDASGIGPELAMKCAALPEVNNRCRPVLYGNVSVMNRIAAAVQLDPPDAAAIVETGVLDVHSVQPGKFTAETGRASFQAVEAAISDSLENKIDGIVTGLIQKKWRAGELLIRAYRIVRRSMSGFRVLHDAHPANRFRGYRRDDTCCHRGVQQGTPKYPSD